MLLQILKAKLKKVIITDANVDYPGSITIDPDLIEAAGMVSYERVEVNSVNGKTRLTTYILPGERGSGQVEMNGGAANFFEAGDEVHVNCFAISEPGEAPFQPIVIYTDENNKVIGN